MNWRNSTDLTAVELFLFGALLVAGCVVGLGLLALGLALAAAL